MCPFQDNILQRALSTRLFDYVWVQFYNNPICNFDANNPTNFKNSWNQWINTITAKNFFVGLPASTNAAQNGFVPSPNLINQLLPIVRAPKYGGVMIWDRFHDMTSKYSSQIKGSVWTRDKLLICLNYVLNKVQTKNQCVSNCLQLYDDILFNVSLVLFMY